MEKAIPSVSAPVASALTGLGIAMLTATVIAAVMVGTYFLGAFCAEAINGGFFLIGKSVLGLILMGIFYIPAGIYWAVKAVPLLACLLIVPYVIMFLIRD